MSVRSRAESERLLIGAVSFDTRISHAIFADSNQQEEAMIEHISTGLSVTAILGLFGYVAFIPYLI